MEKVSIGFLFSKDKKHVSLMKRLFEEINNEILLTGIGGHVDEGEDFITAMRREFIEEAGLDIPDWKQFAFLQRGTDLQVTFFVAFSDDIYHIDTKEHDMSRFYPVNQLHLFKTYPNVPYLIPMALDERLISVNIIE